MEILDNISKLKILVVGDVMLDRYWWGTVDRISPEAPVPIIQLGKMSVNAGGAANVAANLAGLGVTPYLFGIKGHDSEGDQIDEILVEAGITNHSILAVEGRPTTIKTRIIAHSQHVVRIDQESTTPIADETAAILVSEMAALLPEMDAVIVSDYAKGLLSDQLLSSLIKMAAESSTLLVVDPKGRDYLRYKGASVITPNKREAADACGFEPNSSDVVTRAGNRLLADLDLRAVLITEGENGLSLFENENADPIHLRSLAHDVYDVTGAGDTVIAAFTAAAAVGNDLLAAAKLANAAAGIVVGHIGTTRIDHDMLAEFLSTDARSCESLHA